MKGGTVGFIVAMLAGIWTILAPYLVGFGHLGLDASVVRGTVVIGILVIAAAGLGLITFWSRYWAEWGASSRENGDPR
ncbi:MAG: hypothetical protein OWQ57_08245 [Sulfobacillus sp.]|nr:hypothetical protein [Sulfobacillus sp.]